MNRIVQMMVRIAGIAAVLGVLLGALTGRAAADPVYGGEYENSTYGFSFEWDEATWTVDEFAAAGADGVNISTVNSFGMIWGDTVDDATNCYDDMIESLEADSGLEFDVAPDRFERPVQSAALQGELALADFSDETGSYEMLVYAACLSLDGGSAVLNVMLAVDAAVYELELGHWDDLLGTLDVAGVQNGSDDRIDLEFDLGVVDDETDATETDERAQQTEHAERNEQFLLDAYANQD